MKKLSLILCSCVALAGLGMNLQAMFSCNCFKKPNRVKKTEKRTLNVKLNENVDKEVGEKKKTYPKILFWIKHFLRGVEDVNSIGGCTDAKIKLVVFLRYLFEKKSNGLLLQDVRNAKGGCWEFYCKDPGKNCIFGCVKDFICVWAAEKNDLVLFKDAMEFLKENGYMEDEYVYCDDDYYTMNIKEYKVWGLLRSTSVFEGGHHLSEVPVKKMDSVLITACSNGSDKVVKYIRDNFFDYVSYYGRCYSISNAINHDHLNVIRMVDFTDWVNSNNVFWTCVDKGSKPSKEILNYYNQRPKN